LVRLVPVNQGCLANLVFQVCHYLRSVLEVQRGLQLRSVLVVLVDLEIQVFQIVQVCLHFLLDQEIPENLSLPTCLGFQSVLENLSFHPLRCHHVDPLGQLDQ
jgi:hypothetical protein